MARDSSQIAARTLPTRYDFHKARVYLTRQQKNALQLELSRLDKQKIREQIKELTVMEHDKLREANEQKKLIATPDDEKRAQESYKWAFYCREAAKFAGFYLKSLEYQKKI